MSEADGPKPSAAESGSAAVETNTPTVSPEASAQSAENQQMAAELQGHVDKGDAADIDAAVREIAGDGPTDEALAKFIDGETPTTTEPTQEVQAAQQMTSEQPHMVTEELPDDGNAPEATTPDTTGMRADQPLTADDIRNEAIRQRRDGVITPEQAQDTINRADEIAQRNAASAEDTSAPLFGGESVKQTTDFQPGTMRTSEEVAQLTGADTTATEQLQDKPATTSDGTPGTIRTPEEVAQLTSSDATAAEQNREVSATQSAETNQADTSPLSEASGDDIVAEAERATREAAGETQDTATENKADTERTPEQEASEVRLGRDLLVQKLLKENPNIDLSKPEVQAYLDLAGENADNMKTLTEMTNQFVGEQAKAAADKMGLDPETYAKGSVDGIIADIEKKLAELKKAIDSGDKSKVAEADKKGWLLKLLKALGAVIGGTLILAGEGAKGAGEALTGKNKK